MKNITDSVYYVGVNDHVIDLFEGMYIVPNGMAYNSYVVMDKEVSVFDSVDAAFSEEWLANIEQVLGDRQPDYLVVQHMEPDHSACIEKFVKKYGNVKIVANAKTFAMLNQFFETDFTPYKKVVTDGESLCTGEHSFTFVFAPMVHWPEVMVTYDSKDKLLFSADAFGKFGALDAEEEWACEARRYYFGIVGKYGAQVQTLLKKAKELDIRKILPLHGPVLTENLGYYLGLYDTWSSYNAESEGTLIAYASVYGNTKKAAELLAEQLEKKGCKKVVLTDLSRSDWAENVEDAFRYDTLVLASATYNGGLFPAMREFLDRLVERGICKKTIGFIENGTWAPVAARLMKERLAQSKEITFAETTVTLKSAVKDETVDAICKLADELCAGR
ncbi:MAG: FprA family A-type flavoprotein [Lachnospiraceae bacterium]|nr:FprA family A-type flavoprotein [Lachnospiraceae bacterium]